MSLKVDWGNPEERRKYMKEYYKEYYERNKEKLKEKQKEYNKKYRERNKEKLREYREEYRERNKEKLREYGKKYRERVKSGQHNIKSLDIDSLVSILRENEGRMRLDQLPRCVKALRIAKKIGVVSEQNGEIFLTNSPMLSALDGYYREWENSRRLNDG